MRSKTLLSLALLACGLAAGAAALPANGHPFEGGWSGTLVNSAGHTGQVDLSVGPLGGFRGSVVFDTGVFGAFRGQFDELGRFDALLMIPPADGSRFHGEGALIDGRLRGTFAMRAQGVTGALDLGPVPGGAPRAAHDEER